jgi:DNA relaxase NicK
MQDFGCSDDLPEWKFRILQWITETIMTKLKENNVTYDFHELFLF